MTEETKKNHDIGITHSFTHSTHSTKKHRKVQDETHRGLSTGPLQLVSWLHVARVASGDRHIGISLWTCTHLWSCRAVRPDDGRHILFLKTHRFRSESELGRVFFSWSWLGGRFKYGAQHQLTVNFDTWPGKPGAVSNAQEPRFDEWCCGPGCRGVVQN